MLGFCPVWPFEFDEYSKFVLSLCSCVILVKVCCACDVFDYAAFGRVIFNHTSVLSLCSCVVFVNVCYAYERPSRQSSPGAAQSSPGAAHSNTATEQPRAAPALVERS